MANKETDIIKTEINDHILADHYGLSPEFIKNNKNRLLKINESVKKTLHNNNDDDPKRVYDTMSHLQNVISSTFQANSFEDQLTASDISNKSIVTDSGFKMMYGENENREDSEIFGFMSSLFSGYRNLVSEYRNLARLIPEINRCAEMKARDILAINEITKRSIQNVYKKSNTDSEIEDSSYELSKDPINVSIDEKILEKYDIEDKLPRYISTAMIEGAKPVVVYPYKDILSMANYNIGKYNDKFSDFKSKTKNLSSRESLSILLEEYHDKNQKLLPDGLPTEYYKTKGPEDQSSESQTLSTEAFTDSIISNYLSHEDFDEFCNRGLEDLKDYISNIGDAKIMEIAAGNTFNKKDDINNLQNSIKEEIDNLNLTPELITGFKKQILNAVKTIDENVEFYDQTEGPMAAAINNFRKLTKFTAYSENPSTGLIAFNAEMKDKYKTVDGGMDIVKNEFKSVLDNDEELFEANNQSLMKDCIIKEYDSEDIVPVIVSGKHVGYYAIEQSPYTGNLESINKRNCNFTDMFINLGMNNDFPLSPTSIGGGGTVPTGAGNAASSGAGIIPDMTSLGLSGGAGSGMMSSGIDMSNLEVGINGTNARHRNNIMKKIMFNVLKKKLKNDDLEEDKSFTDTILNLIRDGAIIQNRVRVVYIPEKYMCYFAPGLDGNGIPQSFMKDCLFTCYQKVLVNMNNIITRLTRTGTKDKITLNIGQAKNIGQSIRSIENSLTTRRLNVESPFTSLSRVLKSASTSETVIVPVYNGEKLFEYEDISTQNNVPLDDDLESKLTNTIITSLKCPITIMNPYQEEDFASISASRNGEYRLDVIKLQKPFSTTATKFIRLLIVGSGLYDEIIKSNTNFKLKDINVLFSPPENLNMKNATDVFGTVTQYIDNVIQVIIDQDDDSEINKTTKFLLKQRMYQELFPGLNLDKYMKLSESIEREKTVKHLIDKKTTRSINDAINNSKFKAVNVTPDGKILFASNDGIGNADTGGGEASSDW